MTSGTFTSLTIEVSGDGVAQLTLARPELMNRFDDLLHVELTAAITQLRGNPDVRAVVLASTGKVFSAGGDFDLMRAAN
ncbi:MAG: Enoyl-CoA hydratase, partial [Solirubrobacterales bacterium]|nr:Enoyl-CoA hydratase [Solirubrobacterales bacterium]